MTRGETTHLPATGRMMPGVAGAAATGEVFPAANPHWMSSRAIVGPTPALSAWITRFSARIPAAPIRLPPTTIRVPATPISFTGPGGRFPGVVRPATALRDIGQRTSSGPSPPMARAAATASQAQGFQALVFQVLDVMGAGSRSPAI